MCGHVVETDFALAGLPPCTALEGPLGTIQVRSGAAPDRLEGGVPVGRSVEVSPEAMLLTIPEAGRILASGGREIVVDPRPGGELDLQPYVLGSGLGAICLQKGILPLHASAVALETKAIAFAGPSGAGKSTMTAAMVRRGYRHVSDDLCMVSADADDDVLVYPGVPLMKLWPDSVAAVGLDGGDARAELTWHDKLMFDVEVADGLTPSRLGAIYFLETGHNVDIVIEPLIGPHAIAAVAGEIYRRGWLTHMGRMDVIWRQVMQVCRAAACFRIRRPHRFDQLAEVVERVADHQAALAAHQVA